MLYTPGQNNLGTITCSPLFGISKRGRKFIFISTFWWWISIVRILEHTEHCCKIFSKQFLKRFGCDLGLGKLYFAHFTFFSLAFIFFKSDFWVNLYFEGNHKLQPFFVLSLTDSTWCTLWAVAVEFYYFWRTTVKSFLITSTALLTSGEVFQFIAFCQRYPYVLLHIFTFSLASAIGQVWPVLRTSIILIRYCLFSALFDIVS